MLVLKLEMFVSTLEQSVSVWRVPVVLDRVRKGSELHFESGCCGVRGICWEMVFSSKNSPSQLSPETSSTVIPLVLQRDSSMAPNQTLLTPGRAKVSWQYHRALPFFGKNGRPPKLKGWECAVEVMLVSRRGSWSCWR